MGRKEWQSVEAIYDLLIWDYGMCGLRKEREFGLMLLIWRSF